MQLDPKKYINPQFQRYIKKQNVFLAVQDMLVTIQKPYMLLQKIEITGNENILKTRRIKIVSEENANRYKSNAGETQYTDATSPDVIARITTVP